MANSDSFEHIHRLLKAGIDSEALRNIYDERNDKLRSPFDGDPNHAWYIVGDIFFTLDDFENAARAFGRAISFRNDDTQALMALANAYSEGKHPKLAERVLRRCKVLDPNNESHIFNLGNSLFDQEKYEAAIDEYSKIAKSDSELYEDAQRNISASKERIKARQT